MANDTTLYIYIIFMIAGTLLAFFPNKKKTKKVTTPAMSYDDIMAIIDTTVRRELTFKMEDYKLREVVIPDFEYELKTATLDIMDGIGKDLLENAYFYHPKNYYIVYISRIVRTVLVDYINVKKI